MDGDLAWVADHFFVGVDIGGAKVDEDVDDEHDVHHEVHHAQRVAGIAAVFTGYIFLVIQEEGG